MFGRVLSVLISAAAVACASDAIAPRVETPGQSTTGLPPGVQQPNLALAYLTAVLDTIQSQSIRKYEIDWPAFRTDILSRVRGTYKTPPDVYPLIRTAVLNIGDHHSQFIAPPTAAGSSLVPLPHDPYATAVSDKISYVTVPAVSGTGAVADAYAAQLHAAVERVDGDKTCGWIVDLRENVGGNMWPMLLGIAPLFGESDTLGYFVTPDSIRTSWFYRNGSVGIMSSRGRSTIARLTGSPHTMKRPDLPVAVLQNGLTASSGEAILVAFLGRPNVRTFGLPSTGVPTANVGFPFSDGAILNLTTSADVDRSRHVYRESIPPQELVDQPASVPPTTTDMTVVAAQEWLMRQPACSQP